MHAGAFGDVPLQLDLELLLIRGVTRFEFWHFLTKIWLPVVTSLLDMVCIPFFCARLAGCFVESYFTRTLLVRYSGHAYLILRLAIYLANCLKDYLINLHNEIRDSRYLVDTQLTNHAR